MSELKIGKNVLMYGPLPPPVHGQSISFALVTQSLLCTNKYIIDTNSVGKNVFTKLLVTLKVIFRCVYFFLTKKIDMVYFSCSRSVSGAIKDIFLINIASLFGIKMVNHVHGASFDDLINGKPRLWQYLVKSAYNKVQTTIVLLEGMSGPFQRFKSMNIAVIPNFYDPALDNFDEHLAIRSDDSLEILFLSNLMKTKGIIELVDAFLLLSKKGRNIKLNVAGAFMGDDENSSGEIENIFFEKINGVPNIVYHGLVKGEEKSNLLYSNDVFILPSYCLGEAFPLSIIEAMRAGCAIITTRFNYLGEIVRSENGILVNTRDSDGIANALEDLINDPDRLSEIKAHNIQEARSKYSLAASLERLDKIFNN